MDRWIVIYYTSSTGHNPVREFLDARPSVKLKALRILSHIEEFGLLTVISHTKKLRGTPLWEIRILGQDSTRILYITRKQKQIVLLHAFEKKSDKTPLKEITIALSRLNELD